MQTLTTMSNTAEGGKLKGGGIRPLRDKRTGELMTIHPLGGLVTLSKNPLGGMAQTVGQRRGIQVHSNLRAKEWTVVDDAVMAMPRQVFVAIEDLRATGNVDMVGSLGVIRVEWGVSSERPLADMTMDGRTRVDRARTDRKWASVALPITHTEYEFGWRELETSRMTGSDLDADEAREAAISTAETLERMVMLGTTVAGETIYGYTNHPNRLTDTATNYGGGAWSTLGNARASIVGALSALSAIRYRTEVQVYVSPTQWGELMARNTDGSGETELSTVLSIPRVRDVKEHDLLSDGTVLIVGLGTGAFRYQEAMDISNREWSSGDEMAFFAKVMAAATFKMKSDYEDNIPLVHMTGA